MAQRTTIASLSRQITTEAEAYEYRFWKMRGLLLVGAANGHRSHAARFVSAHIAKDLNHRGEKKVRPWR
jgi:hypothetical protein